MFQYSPSCLSAEKNSTRGKVIDKKWLIRVGGFWGLHAGGWEMLCPKNLLGYSFKIKGQVRRWRRTSLSFLSQCHASILSSSSRLSKGVFYSYIIKLGTQITIFHMCREYGLGIINLLGSLGRMWVSCHHCFIGWGYVSCFCSMVLLLSKSSWFCG